LGNNLFVFVVGRTNATITDFTVGVDKLEFDDAGKLDYRNVHVRQEHGDAVITVGNDRVVLTGLDPHQLHPHDLSNLLV
jgi:hypothetical protein